MLAPPCELRGEGPLIALLERLRETFTLRSVTLLERGSVVANVGDEPCTSPAEADAEVKMGQNRHSAGARGSGK